MGSMGECRSARNIIGIMIIKAVLVAIEVSNNWQLKNKANSDC